MSLAWISLDTYKTFFILLGYRVKCLCKDASTLSVADLFYESAERRVVSVQCTSPEAVFVPKYYFRFYLHSCWCYYYYYIVSSLVLFFQAPSNFNWQQTWVPAVKEVVLGYTQCSLLFFPPAISPHKRIKGHVVDSLWGEKPPPSLQRRGFTSQNYYSCYILLHNSHLPLMCN